MAVSATPAFNILNQSSSGPANHRIKNTNPALKKAEHVAISAIVGQRTLSLNSICLG
jgi:hypothetical protein